LRIWLVSASIQATPAQSFQPFMSVPFGWKPIFTAGRPSASPVPRLKKAWYGWRDLLNVKVHRSALRR
jgi:hypothetical protein